MIIYKYIGCFKNRLLLTGIIFLILPSFVSAESCQAMDSAVYTIDKIKDLKLSVDTYLLTQQAAVNSITQNINAQNKQNQTILSSIEYINFNEALWFDKFVAYLHNLTIILILAVIAPTLLMVIPIWSANQKLKELVKLNVSLKEVLIVQGKLVYPHRPNEKESSDLEDGSSSSELNLNATFRKIERECDLGPQLTKIEAPAFSSLIADLIEKKMIGFMLPIQQRWPHKSEHSNK